MGQVNLLSFITTLSGPGDLVGSICCSVVVSFAKERGWLRRCTIVAVIREEISSKAHAWLALIEGEPSHRVYSEE